MSRGHEIAYLVAVYKDETRETADEIVEIMMNAFSDVPDGRDRNAFLAAAIGTAAQYFDGLHIQANGDVQIGPNYSVTERLCSITNSWQKK